MSATSQYSGRASPTPSEAGDTTKPMKLPVPKEIFEHLERRVFGQTDAKRAISVAIYNHYKRIAARSDLWSKFEKELKTIFEIFHSRFGGRKHNEQIGKSNMLLIGPTGCGKTEIARTVAKYLDIPFAICDCTSLTESGYIGDDVEQTLSDLYAIAGKSISKTEMGIIFLDEIDKLRSCRAGYKDVSGRGVQEGLLKILEGNVVRVPANGGQKHRDDIVRIDTSNILFIGSGAFDGLEEIVQERLATIEPSISSEPTAEQESSKAKSSVDNSWLNKIEPQDLIKYRLTPEFVGRFPVVVPLMPLDELALFGILTLPNNSIIDQYKSLYQMDGIELSFDKEAIEEIAKTAHAKKIGARGLRSILDALLINSMFEIPNSNIKRALVTRDAVLGKEVVRHVSE